MILVQNFHLQIESYKKLHYFGAEMTSSVHIDSKNKDILMLGKQPTQWLDDATLTGEAIQPINFSKTKWKICIKPTI